MLAANREAIPENDWNSALIENLPWAFQTAELGFCKPGDPLKYRWMEYLPSELVTEGIWSQLQADIAYRLSDSPVVESRFFGSLVRPRDLRIIPKTFSHQGEPILADLPGKDVYLSERYSGANRVRLKTLGLPVLNTTESLARIQHDISAPESQLRTTGLGDDWHSSFLSMINFLLSTSVKEKVKSLQIIPLATGDWVSQVQSTGRDQVYLPHPVEEDSVRIEIPSNVGLRKLHWEACKVGERRSVYAKLGISQCDPSVIVRKILDAQTTPIAGSILDYVQRFELLFWFGSTPRVGSPNLKAVSENNIVFRTTKLFFRSPGAYHAADLLGEAPITDVPDNNFINATYTDSIVGDFFRHGRSWMQWLENVARVRYYPELLDEDRKSLHPLLKVAARDNSPKFLAALREHWRDSYSQMFSLCSASSLIRGQISQMITRCRNGQTCALSNTLLPTSDAITKSHDFGVEDYIHLLSLPSDAHVSESGTWDFLRTFGVICETNLSFHFNVLEALKQRQLASDRKPQAIIKVYQSIVKISTLGDAALLKVMVSLCNSCVFTLTFNRKRSHLVDTSATRPQQISGTPLTTAFGVAHLFSGPDQTSAKRMQLSQKPRSSLWISLDCGMPTVGIF